MFELPTYKFYTKKSIVGSLGINNDVAFGVILSMYFELGDVFMSVKTK